MSPDPEDGGHACRAGSVKEEREKELRGDGGGGAAAEEVRDDRLAVGVAVDDRWNVLCNYGICLKRKT